MDAAAADPLRALAEKYFHLPCSVMTPNDRRLDVLAPAGRPTIGPQCVIELIWQACLTYDVESHRVKRLVEEELGLPVPADRDRLFALRFRPDRAARGGAVRNGSRSGDAAAT